MNHNGISFQLTKENPNNHKIPIRLTAGAGVDSVGLPANANPAACDRGFTGNSRRSRQSYAGGCAYQPPPPTEAPPPMSVPTEPPASSESGTVSYAPSLTGVIWEWLGSETGGQLTPSGDPSRYQVEFKTDGSLVIQADCNNA